MSSNSLADTAEFVLSAGLPGADAPRPFSSLVRVTFGARSDVGRVRTSNEDHYQIACFSRAMRVLRSNLPDGQVPDRYADVGYLLVVADGMGGAAAGEVASMMAIALGTGLELNQPKWAFRLDGAEADDLKRRATATIRRIQDGLVRHAEADPTLEGMGTTLTAAYSVGDELFVFHVGDSRAYLFRDGALRQLTRDHTVARALADAGQITPEQVATHRKRNVLYNVLGTQSSDVQVEIGQVRLEDGDVLLLCSDGLTDMLDDGELADVLGRIADPEAACDALIELALARGGRDNVTVLAARYCIPPRPDEAAG